MMFFTAHPVEAIWTTVPKTGTFFEAAIVTVYMPPPIAIDTAAC
jgi:hypothetical protein